MIEAATIVVIGSTNVDMVVETPVIPTVGQTLLGGAFRVAPGGKGANQAVAAARAEGLVTFLTAVGDDTLGEESIQRFVHEGIDVRYLRCKAGLATGVALIMVDPAGENIIAVAPGANSELSAADIYTSSEAFADARVALLQLEIPLPTVIAAARLAHNAGCKVVLNPAPMPADGLPDELWSYIDILTPNEGELFTLAGTDVSLEQAAATVLAKGPSALVVTRGKHGAQVFTREQAFHQPAFAVATRDTVGAGDCFSATLSVALAERQALAQAVRFAAAAAALSTTKLGAQEAMPTREEIMGLLASNG